MTSCRTETETVSEIEKAGPFNCCCSHQSVALLYLCLCQGSRWTFWAHFVVFLWFIELCSRWEFGVLLFDCFVYCQNVTCLKRFTRYGHYVGEVEDIIGKLAVLLNRCATIVFLMQFRLRRAAPFVSSPIYTCMEWGNVRVSRPRSMEMSGIRNPTICNLAM